MGVPAGKRMITAKQLIMAMSLLNPDFPLARVARLINRLKMREKK